MKFFQLEELELSSNGFSDEGASAISLGLDMVNKLNMGSLQKYRRKSYCTESDDSEKPSKYKTKLSVFNCLFVKNPVRALDVQLQDVWLPALNLMLLLGSRYGHSWTSVWMLLLC